MNDLADDSEAVLQSLLPEVVSREEWGAAESKNKRKLKTPVKRVIFSTTDSSRCFSKSHCKHNLKQYQKDEFGNGRNDIPYNFLIGSDGRVYEGMGWNYQADCNHWWWWPPDRQLREVYENSVSIAFIQSKRRILSQRQTKTALGLLISGIQMDKLDENVDILEDDVVGPVFSQADILLARKEGDEEEEVDEEEQEKLELIKTLERFNQLLKKDHRITMEEVLGAQDESYRKQFEELDEQLKIENQKEIEKNYPWHFKSKSKENKEE